MPSTQQARTASESMTFLLIIGGILVLLNVLVAYFPSPRVDLTSNGAFSLADGSRKVASKLEDRVEVTAYFTENLPPPFNATEREVRDLLAEYAAVSKGKIRVRFVNPKTEETQRAAEADGIRREAHQKIENDAVTVVEGYRGLVLKYLDQQKTLPSIRDTAGLEYTLTSAIKEVTGQRKKVGVITGHEGPSPQQGLANLAAALRLYELIEVDASKGVDADIAALLVIDPKTELSEQELRNIDSYVMAGGSLGIFGGMRNVDLAAGAEARKVSSGINRLIQKWGVTAEDNIVADPQCMRAPMTVSGRQVFVPYPPIPQLQLDEEQQKHPVMFRLSSPALPFVSSLDVGTAPEQVTLTTIASSSPSSWAMTGEAVSLRPRDPREWQMTGDTGPFPLIVAIEGRLPSAFFSPVSEEDSDNVATLPSATANVRVLVAGTSTFLTDLFMPDAQDVGQMNSALALALNAVDWLAADSDLIAIRAKTVEDPALDIPDSVLTAESDAMAAAEVGDKEGVERAIAEGKAAIKAWNSRKLAYRWGNTLGIPVLFTVFGLIRWRLRASRKRTLKP